MVMTGIARAFALAGMPCAGLAAADTGVGSPGARPTGTPSAGMSLAVPGDAVVAERLSTQNAAGRSCIRSQRD